MIAHAQAWLDFLWANADKLAVIIPALVGIALTVAGLIRAQVKLWRAEEAGARVTAAVTESGAEPDVRRIMDTAPDKIKATVKGWIKLK